ncbi:hypothetical protein U9M48_005738, partial [Paspalum notatum var. saurae]
IPKKVRDRIDKLRKRFLWYGHSISLWGKLIVEMIIDRVEVETINSFLKSELLKEVYGLIWILPILALLLGITIQVLVIVWLEREISASIQQRIGPEYAGPLGLLQAIADGTKLLLKEDILPSRGDIPLFSIGPSIAVISILLSFLVIPLGYRFVLADLSIGVFLWIAISSIAPIGLLMAGYSSNNKYSFSGGLRAAAQSISYEIPLTFCVLAISLQCERLPFDLPEAEEELVAVHEKCYTLNFFLSIMDLPGPIHEILVLFGGFVLLLGGLGVVLLTNPIYSAFSLGLVLVCISLFYFLLNSYFVAVAQLLIYVGAINVLIIFAVMFVNGSEWSKDKNSWTIGDGFTLLVCITIPFSLMTTIPDTSWYGILWTTRSNQIVEQGLINNVQQIGIHLATDFYLPFELISLILLVSLIGAITMARQ